MDSQQIRAGQDALIRRYGPWTDHNIRLTDDVYTMDRSVASEKLRRVVQIVSDMARKPVAELRILDLACLEGGYAIEFARHGAQVVAIEGREANIEKARFSKQVLGLDQLELIQADVRSLSRATHGTFDVVLCLGILYHLDAPDVFSFVEQIGEVCQGFAVFDTYVSLEQKRSYAHNGATLWGRDIQEHVPEESQEEKLQDLWSSIENLKSVWMTTPTLLNLLTRSGFTSAYECQVPVELNKPSDRVTLLAIKGQPQRVINSPCSNDVLPAELPEQMLRKPSHHQAPFADASRQITQMVPRSLRRGVKDALRAIGVLRPENAPWKARPPGI
jgi:2-polyprenyl-3-methyl-5-hydroxy-6-metoxy-1,4-benzoquinol methylase